jgi:hypothetical protein
MRGTPTAILRAVSRKGAQLKIRPTVTATCRRFSPTTRPARSAEAPKTRPVGSMNPRNRLTPAARTHTKIAAKTLMKIGVERKQTPF